VASEDIAVVDILSAVLRDRYGCWGVIELWRYDGSPFGAEELDFLSTLLPPITQAQRARVAWTFRSVPSDEPAIPPALVLFDDELNAVGETAAAEHTFRRLLPTEPAAEPVRGAALNVAAQLLAVEAGVDACPATARVHLGGGTWLTCTAARLRASGSMPASIAVTIDPIAPADRVDIFSRAHGLTARETDVLFELSRGNSTRIIARDLGLSEYTVQEHLKAIFTKSDTASRAELVARACGSAKA
jgi:DNA-binding NarL/FixJ family response regulator